MCSVLRERERTLRTDLPDGRPRLRWQPWHSSTPPRDGGTLLRTARQLQHQAPVPASGKTALGSERCVRPDLTPAGQTGSPREVP